MINCINCSNREWCNHASLDEVCNRYFNDNACPEDYGLEDCAGSSECDTGKWCNQCWELAVKKIFDKI
jgi:hypothetical protein